MPNPAGDDERARGGPDLITFGQMPKRLEAAGLPKLSHQRCRQLAEQDPDWPIPMDQAIRVGRMRLFDWKVLEPYFQNRIKRQGQRTDLNAPRREPADGEHPDTSEERGVTYLSERDDRLEPPLDPPQWRCRPCGASGDDGPGLASAEYLARAAQGVVYHRAYCDACLPSPPGRQDPADPEWHSYYRACGERTAALECEADEGALGAVEPVHRIPCVVCGAHVVADEAFGRLVYALESDRDEAVCGPCMDSQPDEVIEEAYRLRENGLTPMWSRRRRD